MELSGYFLLAVGAVGVSCLVSRFFDRLNERVVVILVGLLIALAILILPFENQEGGNFLSSFMYAFNAIQMQQDSHLVTGMESSEAMQTIYIVAIYVLFVTIPMMTGVTLLSYFSNYVNLFRFWSSRLPVVIFSEMNERTIEIACNLYHKHTMVIFANYDFRDKGKYHKFAGALRYIKNDIKLPNPVTEIKVRRHREAVIYAFTDNEEQNLIDTLRLLKMKSAGGGTKIYTLSSSENTMTILDSADKNDKKIVIVNEVERKLLRLLDEKPLYLGAKDKVISVLIAGGSRACVDFLKTAAWMGQLPSYKLKIAIVCAEAGEIEARLRQTHAGLLKNQKVEFVASDLYSAKVPKDVNYCFVDLPSDEEKISAAVYLRSYFLRADGQNHAETPVIAFMIEDDVKMRQLHAENLITAKGDSLDFCTFGSVEELYGGLDAIVGDSADDFAKQIHVAYGGTLENYYDKEYDQKSSRACASHLKYKVYATLVDGYDGDLAKDMQDSAKIPRIVSEFEKVLPNTVDELTKNEHDRWNSYIFSEGFDAWDAGVAKKTRGDRRHYLAKLHAALVPFEELPKVEKELGMEAGQLINNDKLVVLAIPKILRRGRIYSKKEEQC